MYWKWKSVTSCTLLKADNFTFMTLTSLPPAFKGAGPTGAHTGTIGSWL